MKRTITALLLGVALVLFTGASAQAADCEFRLGFKTLRDLIGHDTVGECLENEHYNEISDSNQQTTGGLMAWRKADNRTAFTDGAWTWINGPYGLQKRINWRRFPWEPDYRPDIAATPQPVTPAPPPTPGPPPPPAPTPVPQPTIDPTLAHAYHAMRNTTTGNYVADLFVRLGASATFGTEGNSFTQYRLGPPRIAISEDYRLASPEVIAFILIHPTVALFLQAEQGDPPSAEACLSRQVHLYTLQAQYWLEVYGTTGKRNPTELEQYPNSVLNAHIAGGIARLMSTAYGEICAQFGGGAVSSVPTPIPTPTPTPRPTIDPTLAHAYHIMRNTPTGNKIADKFVQLGMSAVFGRLDGLISQVNYSSRRITINEQYRYESYEALAYALIWPTMALMLEAEDGPAQSWEACMLRQGVREGFGAQYWMEAFGANGKRNPSQLEQGANNDVSWLVADNLKYVWMDSYWRDECNEVGAGAVYRS